MLVKAYSSAVWSVLVKQERRGAEKSGAEKERQAWRTRREALLQTA